MRRYALVAAMFSFSLLSGIGPATATDQGAAVQLCAKNPQCGLTRSQGGVNLWVDLPGGGTSEVWCPDKGECVCLTYESTPPPKRTFSQVGQYFPQTHGNAPQSLSSPVTDSAPAAPAAPPPDGGGDDLPIP